MTRLLVIMGSGETTPTMIKPHRRIFETVPADSGAVLLDTPYGFQLNANEISARTVNYFAQSVGRAIDVVSWRTPPPPGLERERALTKLRAASWIFAGPGSPTYALRQWRDTELPDLMLQTEALVFASAAALTLGSHTVPVYEIYKAGITPHWEPGLDLFRRLTGVPAVIIPHYDNAEGGHHDTRFCYLGEPRLSYLEHQLPAGTLIIGVDEHTALFCDLEAGNVTVVGNGGLTLRSNGSSVRYKSGTVLPLPFDTAPTGSPSLSTTTASPDSPSTAPSDTAPATPSAASLVASPGSALSTNAPNSAAATSTAGLESPAVKPGSDLSTGVPDSDTPTGTAGFRSPAIKPGSDPSASAPELDAANRTASLESPPTEPDSDLSASVPNSDAATSTAGFGSPATEPGSGPSASAPEFDAANRTAGLGSPATEPGSGLSTGVPDSDTATSTVGTGSRDADTPASGVPTVAQDSGQPTTVAAAAGAEPTAGGIGTGTGSEAAGEPAASPPASPPSGAPGAGSSVTTPGPAASGASAAARASVPTSPHSTGRLDSRFAIDTDPTPTSLRAIADILESRFAAALSKHDIDACAAAALELEQAITDWTADTLTSSDTSHARGLLRSMIVRLGTLPADPTRLLAPLVEPLLAMRAEARARKDFATSDLIRDTLLAAGLEIRDTPTGPQWTITS